MNESQVEAKPDFIIDLPNYPLGEQIIIHGIVEKNQKFRKKNIRGVTLRDITGTILSIIDTAQDPIAQKWNPKSVHVGTRIRIIGHLGESRKKELIVNNILDIQVLASPETIKLSELDPDMRDQASSMLISRICHKISETLDKEDFIEFNSRVISQNWNDDGLEPMLVLYPGFGCPAVLVPSPSAQIIEFLTTWLISRAFSISTSFSQTFRFDNSVSEMCVAVAKATDLSLNDQIKLLKELSEEILSVFIEDEKSYTTLEGKWPDTIDGVNIENKSFSADLNLIIYSANIPVIGENWDTHISHIIHLQDKEKNILAEGSREVLTDKIEISTIIIYPSQFLRLIEKAPGRQLRNLMRLYNG